LTKIEYGILLHTKHATQDSTDTHVFIKKSLKYNILTPHFDGGILRPLVNIKKQ